MVRELTYLEQGAPEPVAAGAQAVAPTPSEEQTATPLSEGAKYLINKYGRRPTVVAMRTSENEHGKSTVRGTRPVAVMVSWVFDVEDIVAKNQRTRVPGTKGPGNPKGKAFVQHDFRILFNRQWKWIEEAVDAADAIRKRRAKLQQAGDPETLKDLEDFLAGTTAKVGARSLGALVKVFGKKEGEVLSEDDSEDEEEDEGERD